MNKYVEYILSAFHYLVTFIFFLTISICSYFLTLALLLMKPNKNDINAVKAKKYLETTVIIGWITVGIILICLLTLLILGLKGEFKNPDFISNLKYITGQTKVFLSFRIITFSILMVASIVMGILCVMVYKNIKLSKESIIFEMQLFFSKECAKFLLLHTLVFLLVQGILFILSYFLVKKKEDNKSE
jgi:hypothetical protein